ncbi:TIGR03943 family putative permease subunit [Gordoniibacillus kamchatkensis]|uniref:TIGR03943 family putative permease subunit n=1 Tax=Gordoniibacillus kamchatkensis TaxID=1590651 RepID=UPI0009E1F544
MDIFKEQFCGKKIELSGFVYREDDLKPDQLVVGRFAVSYCSADASPYSVLKEFPNAKAFAKDTWVKRTGTIEQGHYHDNDIIKVHATKIEKIAAPASPYAYPNMDPVTELKKQG